MVSLGFAMAFGKMAYGKTGVGIEGIGVAAKTKIRKDAKKSYPQF